MREISKVALNNFKKCLIGLVLLVGLLSCNQPTKDKEISKEPTISTFYLIRHAEKEKSDPNNIDPELMQEGLDRAIRWAEIFDQVPLDAIYSTNYQRTLMTAAPTSVKKDIDVQYYDPRDIDVEILKSDNEGKNVLIVGHSNSTPALTNKILGLEKYDAMQEDDNGSLFIIRVIDGKATDIRLKMY
ncbi:SixA phosphatase family protein [Croceitalea rosinachiae]|uniref:Histidine phosphatase family protein n=1 Tax=Croceitalea rosinachiae TaxID=3075596 RepID=A0ABU3AAV3_9FLAO|nr:histidine phosphatase family protein [Croceitalea sp. F388]MDT0607294.1 histidine phosphatase family protein [Croceitalea sp. F388]